MTRSGTIPAILVVVVLLGLAAHALADWRPTPAAVVVVYNQGVAASRELARLYAQGRRIPAANLIGLSLPTSERISRPDYNRQLARPLAAALTGFPRPLVVVLTYGVPLAVGKAGVRPGEPASGIPESQAAVDSELALLDQRPHRLRGWLPNPWLADYDHDPGMTRLRQRTLMVCRLDGPDPATVERIIGDSLAAERQGLTGTACIDARGLSGKQTTHDDAYAAYDRRLLALRDLLQRRRPAMDLVFDDRPQLLDHCAGAALYCGWYALADYRDVFTFRPGAVGFHIASAEASTLRHEKNTWCRQLLLHGVAATLGPVNEPYLASFPDPPRFFGLLLDGEPLILAYYRTLPFLSWQQVLIGDPLYRPFGAPPR